MKKSGRILLLCSLALLVFAFRGAGLQAQEERIDIGPKEEFQKEMVKPLPQYKLIVFSDGENVWAMSSTCTHKGCTVSWREAEKGLACPCHGARFGKDGQVLRGPAEKSLPAYAVGEDAKGHLFVDKGVTVDPGVRHALSVPQKAE